MRDFNEAMRDTVLDAFAPPDPDLTGQDLKEFNEAQLGAMALVLRLAQELCTAPHDELQYDLDAAKVLLASWGVTKEMVDIALAVGEEDEENEH